VFLAAILATVAYLVVTRRDFIEEPAASAPAKQKGRGPILQVVVVLVVLLSLGVTGYYARRAQLGKQAAASVTPGRPLGDLSKFRTVAQDMLSLVRAGDWNGAKSRAADLESAWDDGQARMQPMNPDEWTQMDNAIDVVLKKTRASSPDAAAVLEALLGVTDSLDHGN
jgi:uncharacterized protein HemX